jgi:hypothetical protein
LLRCDRNISSYRYELSGFARFAALRMSVVRLVEDRKAGPRPSRRALGVSRTPDLGAGFGFGGDLLGLLGQGLIDFQIGHFQFAQEVDQKIFVFGGQVAGGFFV